MKLQASHECSQALHKHAVTALVAQLRACVVDTLDKGDLAAAEAGAAGDLETGAATLPAAVWSAWHALAAAVAAAVAESDVGTSNMPCYTVLHRSHIRSQAEEEAQKVLVADNARCGSSCYTSI